MKLSFRIKILLIIGLVGTVCTGISVYLSNRQLHADAEKALQEKSKAILSRLSVGAKYVAEMHTLEGIIEETIKKFPDGKFPEEQKMKILKSVPIYAAFQIGKEGAAIENYKFRIATDVPRNSDNKATPQELMIIEKFKSDPGLTEYIYKSDDQQFLSVVSPVRIKESQNCLSCHGNPINSPWRNGKDILGYQMENMKEGDLKATFAIVSSLEPVYQHAAASTKTLLLFGSIGTLFCIGLAFLLIRKPIGEISSLADRVSQASEEINQAAESLAAASQELASSSQEQSSSVEETSSSLEEISGMVSSAVKTSQESVELSHKVTHLVKSGTASMAELQASVQKIAEANTRVESLAKLIEEIGEKTELIDEIVFQTRLLSFNASVEAERAGEHGRGFAVVAQEVGNLAQMSGKSATEISQIVKNSIKEAQEVVKESRAKVEEGVTLCKKTADELRSIEEASKQILIGAEQVLRASEEQNTGIQQINQSINLISRATQENASSAEECSGSSQALMSQGENLTEVVSHLEVVVHGQHLVKSTKIRNQTEKAKKAEVVADNVVALSRTMVPKTLKATGTEKSHGVKGEDDPWEKI